ncbi:MAG: response regulator transcription factor [Bacillota bacterium]
MEILLVDDEEYVLDYLEETIEWSTFGVERIHKSFSVDEALDITNQVNISIVITDIRMPEKSGLELLQTLRQRKPDIKVILLSGYSEFEYAKIALKNGATDYLLKPILEEDLIESIKKVLIVINEEKQNKIDLATARDVLKHGAFRMREHLLLDLLHGKKFSDDELLQNIQPLNIDIHLKQECILAMIKIETISDSYSKEDFELFSSTILNLAEGLFYGRETTPNTIWSCTDYHHFIIMVLPTHNKNDFEHIQSKLNELIEIVNSFLKRSITILLSPTFTFYHELHSIYIKTLNYFLTNMVSTPNTIHTMDQISTKGEYKTLSKLHESPAILHLMEGNRWDEVSERIDAVLQALDHSSCHTHSQRIEVVYYLYSCFSYMSHQTGDPISDIIGDLSFFQSQFHFHSTDQIRQWSESLINQYKRSINEDNGGKSHIIRQVQKFIENNFKEDVSLNKIGEHVYLHPVYLSRLYKKETGESLSSYILRTRMENASHLLTNTNKKIGDIAIEVGYQKTQYFIRLFKEFYHTTPQKYRNEMN